MNGPWASKLGRLRIGQGLPASVSECYVPLDQFVVTWIIRKLATSPFLFFSNTCRIFLGGRAYNSFLKSMYPYNIYCKGQRIPDSGHKLVETGGQNVHICVSLFQTEVLKYLGVESTFPGLCIVCLGSPSAERVGV